MNKDEIATFVENLLSGSIKHLAKAITLVESSNKRDIKTKQQILELISKKNHLSSSARIAFSGIPGVGKSSLIEVYGSLLIAKGHKVAVLAIDPSSPINGGSILADKHRMNKLSTLENAFIRPSPTCGNMGGVASQTRETILLCEACGFDRIIIETVGVGQSEYDAASLVDIFVFIQMPASGDDIQGVKKGILELADLVVINKADGNLEHAAKISASQLQQSLSLNNTQLQNNLEIILTSATANIGIETLESAINKYLKESKKVGNFEKKRSAQKITNFTKEIKHNAFSYLQQNKNFQLKMTEQLELLNTGSVTLNNALEAIKNYLK